MANQTTTILNDKAVESLKNDALDFAPYVRALAKIVMTGGTPLTIGIFGSWGSGKTSLMRMVQEQVKTNGAVAGWFDAWKYDKEETLWRAFLLSVLSAVRATIRDGDPTEDLDYLETMLYRAIDFEKVGGVTIDLAKLGGKSLHGAVQIGLSFIPGGAALGKIIEELQKAGTDNLSQGALDAVQRERTKIHIEQVRFLEQFQDKFRELVRQRVLNNKGRLVVFVDDLDRCLPEKAIEVLEAIKLFVDAPGCVFVLGLDQEVIARGVQLRYHEFARDGQNSVPIDGAKYIEKIIQLPFQIPPVESADMGDFVSGLSGDWPHAECPRVFAEGLGDNPRQIKRTVNVFLMLWSLAAERKDKLQGAIKPVRLAKVLALQAMHLDLYNLLKEEPRYLRDLEVYYLEEARITRNYDSIHDVPDKVLKDVETGKGRVVRLSATDDQEAAKKPELPPALSPYASLSTLRRVFTLHSPEMAEFNFAELSPADLRLYFTLTRRIAAAPASPAEAARLPFEPQTVKIPAGTFRMGSTSEQAGQAVKDGAPPEWVKSEQPLHDVELSEYSIGKYPITNREYQAFVKESPHVPPRNWNGDQYPPEKGDHPVVNVSWQDATAYCAWLSEKTRQAWRLPTEAEWEKAARGEDERVWPWGGAFGDMNANTIEMKIGETTPVGQFSPQGDSPYGCADVVGNVWEWCADWYGEKEYESRKAGVQDPRGPESGNTRVLRGGSFNHDRWYARGACRYRSFPDDFYDNVGFRVFALPSLNLLSDPSER